MLSHLKIILQQSRHPEAVPLPEAIRPSTSRRSFDKKKSASGRGKAGIYKLVPNKSQFQPGGEPEPEKEKESLKELWRKWNADHQGKMKKEVSRLLRNGTEDVVCKTCRRSIAVSKWYKHRTAYNYCKPGDKYLKFDNFKRDFPCIVDI